MGPFWSPAVLTHGLEHGLKSGPQVNKFLFIPVSFRDGERLFGRWPTGMGADGKYSRSVEWILRIFSGSRSGREYTASRHESESLGYIQSRSAGRSLLGKLASSPIYLIMSKWWPSKTRVEWSSLEVEIKKIIKNLLRLGSKRPVHPARM